MSGTDSETGIWDISIAKKRHKLDEGLTRKMVETFPIPMLAADLGCGIGHYCKLLRELGWPEVHGYEGTQGIAEVAVYGDIFTVDFTKRRFVNIPYDFVLCIEVGEHVPPQHEQVLLDNVADYCAGYLVMSWAEPGQYSASGHVNCRENKYVIEQMWERGFRRLRGETNELRAAADLKWLKNTVLAFRRVDGR